MGNKNHLPLAVFCMALTMLLAANSAVAAALTLQDAIAKVERDTKGKVLSSETRHIGKQTMYRIKVLTREGQVKVIEVAADGT